MNLGRLIEECQHRSGLSDSAYRNKWVNFLNGAIREFARSQPWDGLEDNLDLVADGTTYLVLPHFVDSVVSLFDVTNSYLIDRQGPLERFDPAAEAAGTAGRALVYDRSGDVPATKAPTGYVWFSSSHASDIYNVTVTGLVSQSAASGTALSSYLKSLTILSSGTTPVTLTELFTRFVSISKSTETNGDFFFRDAAASNAQLAFIPANETDSLFHRLKLRYVPSAGTVLRLKFRYKPPTLREESDAPPPAVKPDFLIEHALASHWAEQEQYQKSQLQESKAQRVLANEANKDENFNEPYSQIQPQVWIDRDDIRYQ